MGTHSSVLVPDYMTRSITQLCNFLSCAGSKWQHMNGNITNIYTQTVSLYQLVSCPKAFSLPRYGQLGI